MSPRLVACLLCEGLRPEAVGKTTILGFFGVLPQVTIQVVRLDQPLPQLSFVVQSDEPEAAGEANLRIVIYSPDGTELISLEYPKVQWRHGKKMLVAFNIVPFPISGAGRYTVHFEIDGVRSYESAFSIEAMPAELASALTS